MDPDPCERFSTASMHRYHLSSNINNVTCTSSIRHQNPITDDRILKIPLFFTIKILAKILSLLISSINHNKETTVAFNPFEKLMGYSYYA